MASCLTLSVTRLRKINLDINTVVTVSWSTLFVPSWNRSAVIIDGVVMVLDCCLTVSALKRKKYIARQNYCSHGQLPDLLFSQFEQNSIKSRGVTACCLILSGPRCKIVMPDRNTVVMASCLTVFCCQVEQNTSNAIKYIVFMVMASCPTVSMPKGKVLTLGGITR